MSWVCIDMLFFYTNTEGIYAERILAESGECSPDSAAPSFDRLIGDGSSWFFSFPLSKKAIALWYSNWSPR